MVSILPDEVLDNLLCSACKKYLSCGPVKVTKQGALFCGRCTTKQPSSPSVLYEQVARFSIFPCINRYEGCNMLLRYQDVIQHEKGCTSNVFPCPICPVEKYMPNSILHLIDHYKTVHSKYFLKKPAFYVDPSMMSEDRYLFCDNFRNCLFLLKVGCNEEQIFLSACAAGKNSILGHFKVNNILLQGDHDMCSYLYQSPYNYLAIKLKYIGAGETGTVLCKFEYQISEKMASVLSFDPNTTEQVRVSSCLRRLPKLYLNPRFFPGKKEDYKLSHCKTQLVNGLAENFAVDLKCFCCNRYFWNISVWHREFTSELCPEGAYILYIFNNFTGLVCHKCKLSFYDAAFDVIDEDGGFHNALFDQENDPHIFRLRFYCRHDCGEMYPVWQLCEHEKECEFNLAKLSDVDYVKTCFGQDSYENDALFVNGNIVDSFSYVVGIFLHGLMPNEIESPEKVIYVVTDDGQKCKLYYRYVNGQFQVTAKDYDKSKHLVFLRSSHNAFNEYVTRFSVQTSYLVRDKPEGIMVTSRSAYFAVWIKPVESECSISV